MENGVETEVAKPELIDGRFQLRLTVVANECARKIGAYREIEKTVDRLGCLSNVEPNVTWSWLRLRG